MFGYFKILAAIPGFFLSSFILMLLWGVIVPDLLPIASDYGIDKISYPMAMLITIALWLAVAPLAAAASGKRK